MQGIITAVALALTVTVLGVAAFLPFLCELRGRTGKTGPRPRGR